MCEFLYASKSDLDLFRHFEITTLREYKETQEKLALGGATLNILLMIPFIISVLAMVYIFSIWCLLFFGFLPYVYNVITQTLAQLLSNALLHKMSQSHTWLQVRLLYEKILTENGFKDDGVGFEDISSSPWYGTRYVLKLR